MEVGELHLERALASLSRSFLFFSLSPDWASVAREAALAAEAFHAAGLCCREAKALRLCAQAERNLGKPRAAGKAMQKLGDLMMKEKKAARRSSNSGSSKSSVGGAAAAAYEEAMQCYGEAICFFRAAGAVDLAVPLLLKVSAKREQEKTDKGFGLCAEAYEEALHLLITKHDLQQADEVYRHYICSLALRSSFLGSPEFAAGAAAVDASKVGDNVRLAEALEAPVFRLLLPPVAALAAQRAAAVRCCSGANSSREFNEIGFSGEAIDLLLMSETQALNPTP
ncbi:hypothetical protein, conserved [Eimeria acervulina]|uniref:Gamma-soluble NSF attachment protein n=1 Tax=Eimeria acervulina TaxID=5801 RepID=U6GAL8_EIMAC|nr:hypothetical protein, conserved [Eimeria acervulina]CDI77175.1 hypothetical protein, conserved [Eimeria acervulina]